MRELTAGQDQDNDRRLHLEETTYSAITDDNGASGSIFGLGFSVPSAITEASFSVFVKDAKTVGCGSNPSGAVDIGPEFRGRFFNTESSPATQLGDVEGGIGAYRTPSDLGSAIQVTFHFERCDDDFCSTRTPLGFGVIGYIQPGTTNTFHIKWDQANHRFIYQLNNGPLVVSPYTVSDSSPPSFTFRTIDIARQVAHCTTTPRPFASINAYFDNVRINPWLRSLRPRTGAVGPFTADRPPRTGTKGGVTAWGRIYHRGYGYIGSTQATPPARRSPCSDDTGSTRAKA